MMKYIILFFVFGMLVQAGPTTQIIVLSSHKAKKKAKLQLPPLEKDFFFFPGYPKLVESKLVGLKPGQWVWIGGYCRSDESINFVFDRNKQSSVMLPLDEQKFLIAKLKLSIKSAYTQTVKASEVSCPLFKLKMDTSFVSKAGPSDNGIRWVKKPFSFPELSRFAIYLSPEKPESSNYLASYGYKYMQKDQSLLEIIYQNNFATP